MTNFEYLKSLSLEEFGREVLKQVAKVHSDCFHSELDIFDIINDEEYAFENYLNAEHGKKVKVNVCFNVRHKDDYSYREAFVTLEIPIEDYEQYIKDTNFENLQECGSGWAENFETEAKDLLRKSISSPIDQCYIYAVKRSDDNEDGGE